MQLPAGEGLHGHPTSRGAPADMAGSPLQRGNPYPQLATGGPMSMNTNTPNGQGAELPPSFSGFVFNFIYF